MVDAKQFYEGGGMAAQHRASRVLPLYVASATGDELNTIRFNLVVVACWRINEVLFDFDSSVVKPGVADEIRRLAELVAANPGSPASIFGHADPIGDDSYNKRLSDRRAEAIFALLTRDVSIWERLFDQPTAGDRWGIRALQLMLSHLRDPQNEPFYRGAIDGIAGDGTTAAIRGFQGTNGLTVDGIAGPKTRSKLFRAYMDAVAVTTEGPFVMDRAAFLGEGKDPDGKAAYQGCTEFNPVVLLSKADLARLAQSPDKTERNERNAPNRRVMMFLFRADTKVEPADWPCPRVGEGEDACRVQFWPNGEQRRQAGDAERQYRVSRDTFACRFYDRLARVSPCEGIVVPVVRIKLFDIYGHPIRGAPLQVSGPGFSVRGTAADAVAIVHGVPAPSTVHLQWSRTDEERRATAAEPGAPLEEFEYELDVFIDLERDSREISARRRLNNLGHGSRFTFEEQIRSFQRDCLLDPTGNLDDVEEELERRHDRLNPLRHTKPVV